MPQDPLQIGMLLYPNLTQLDLTGPFEVFSRLPDSRVHLLWKTREPVASDTGLALLPTTTLAECPALDVLFVPGGRGQIPLMDDPEVLDCVPHGPSSAAHPDTPPQAAAPPRRS